MVDIVTPFAISGINEPEKIRVLLYANNEVVHAPLNAVLKAGMMSNSNENGDYIRFADGTQICWANVPIELTPINDSLVQNWVFPVPFIKTPVVNVTPLLTNDGKIISLLFSEMNNVQVCFVNNNDDAHTINVSIQVMAIGRWF